MNITLHGECNYIDIQSSIDIDLSKLSKEDLNTILHRFDIAEYVAAKIDLDTFVSYPDTFFRESWENVIDEAYIVSWSMEFTENEMVLRCKVHGGSIVSEPISKYYFKNEVK